MLSMWLLSLLGIKKYLREDGSKGVTVVKVFYH